MTNDSPINKVNATGILTVDPLDYQPTGKSISLDLKDFLYQGLIIQEKHFKESLAKTYWSQYEHCHVAIHCSVGAIIPPWAYMMLVSQLTGLVKSLYFGSNAANDLKRWQEKIKTSNFEHYKDKKVVVRAHVGLDPSIFITLSHQLLPLVKSLMYGEAGLPKVIWKAK